MLEPFLQFAVSNERHIRDKLSISELQGLRLTENVKIIPHGERKKKSRKVTETAR